MQNQKPSWRKLKDHYLINHFPTQLKTPWPKIIIQCKESPEIVRIIKDPGKLPYEAADTLSLKRLRYNPKQRPNMLFSKSVCLKNTSEFESWLCQLAVVSPHLNLNPSIPGLLLESKEVTEIKCLAHGRYLIDIPFFHLPLLPKSVTPNDRENMQILKRLLLNEVTYIYNFSVTVLLWGNSNWNIKVIEFFSGLDFLRQSTCKKYMENRVLSYQYIKLEQHRANHSRDL